MHTPVEHLHSPLPVRRRRLSPLDEQLLVVGVAIESKRDVLSSVAVMEINVEDDGPVNVVLEVG